MTGMSSVLQFSFPTSIPMVDWKVSNDGVDDHIIFWNTSLLGPQPSEATLAATQASAPYIAWNTPSEAANRNQAKNSGIVGLTTALRKSADQAVTSTTFVDVADMTFQLLPNKNYKFSFSGAYNAALATTGLQLSVNGPASPNFARFVGSIATSPVAVFYGAAGAYDVAIPSTTSGGATALPFNLAGTISTGAAGGGFTLRARTTVAASAVTLLRGCWAELSAVGN